MAGAREPNGKIGPQVWLTAPATHMVFKALEAGGGEVRFVGGCVRDALLQRPVRDIDIATTDKPEKVIELLQAANIKAIPTGLAHGTVTAVIDGACFQITTLRVDVKTNGRHAEVIFTDDWEADAARRDFTINTMSCTLNGDVYDVFGGMDDLGRKLVRFVGIARERIDEDVLRILRFFRFHAAYGRRTANASALSACREMVHRLQELSGERIRDEIFSILMGPNPADTMQLMRGEQVLEQILPEAGDIGRLRQLSWLEGPALKVKSITADPLRRLASLLKADDTMAGDVASRLVLSKRQMARLKKMVNPVVDVRPNMTKDNMRTAIKRQTPGLFMDMALLAWAGQRATLPRHGSGHNQAWMDMLELIAGNIPAPFPIGGKDVIALGVSPGPYIGELLTTVEEWWENTGCKAGRDECLQKLKRIVESYSSA